LVWGSESVANTKRIGRAASSACGIIGVVLFVPTLAVAAAISRTRPELTLAYIDPGTGSFVVQALVAAVAGIAVTLRLYWSKIKGFFGGSATVATDGEEVAEASRDDD
jgi:hypothetical protein